jgi:hypothetical protein
MQVAGTSIDPTRMTLSLKKLLPRQQQAAAVSTRPYMQKSFQLHRQISASFLRRQQIHNYSTHHRTAFKASFLPKMATNQFQLIGSEEKL